MGLNSIHASYTLDSQRLMKTQTKYTFYITHHLFLVCFGYLDNNWTVSQSKTQSTRIATNDFFFLNKDTTSCHGKQNGRYAACCQLLVFLTLPHRKVFVQPLAVETDRERRLEERCVHKPNYTYFAHLLWGNQRGARTLFPRRTEPGARSAYKHG